MRVWSLYNKEKLMYAVAYGKNLKDAIERTCRDINETGRATEEFETTLPEEWLGEEFTEDSYNGVLLYY